MTTIVLDAMGSDNYPDVDVHGAVMAARAYDLDLILVGDEKQIRAKLAEYAPNESLRIRVVHAPEMLSMNDKGDDLSARRGIKTRRTRWLSAWTWSRAAKRTLSSQLGTLARRW